MIAHRLVMFLVLGLALLLSCACREAAPVLDEEDEAPSPTPELAPPTAVAEATAVAQATRTPTSTMAVPTPTTTLTATAPPTPTATLATSTPAPATSTATPASPAPSATPCGPPPAWVEYTVVSGDTLSGLAQATATTVAEIQLANCLEDTLIFAASRLYLPALPATPTATATPLPPPPLVVGGSQPLGTAPVAGELIYDDAFLVRIDVRRPSAGDENGAGIDRIEFVVSHEGIEVYHHTEETPAYCIFGGGEPDCNPWPLEAGVYRWGIGGPPIEPGHYLVRAWLYFTPESDDGSGITHDFWDFSFDLATPGPSRIGP
jgi:LysM repeat protein